MKINKIEVIDHTKDLKDGGGRVYMFWSKEGGTEVELDYQDGGKTLKVSINNKEQKDEKKTR